MEGRRLSFAKLLAQLGTAGGNKLYGRQKEEAVLATAFERVCREKKQELVLVSGSPGSGKTALACSLRNVAGKERGYFVSGKFEEAAIQEPYEVFTNALTDYTDQFLDASDDKRLDEIRVAVRAAVGAEGRLLTDAIPALERLLGKTNNPTKVYGLEAQNRFRFVFCNFIRALTRIAPLVLFLDDLQWADTASCELVRSLMHTEDMPLLMIGAHRCDLGSNAPEQDPNQVICVACMEMKPFVATMKDLDKELTNRRMQKIDLKELDVQAVNWLLQDLLKKTAKDTIPLADTIIQQTQGNVFHVLQFVRLLLDQEFLMRDLEERWTWDIGVIKSKLRAETIMDIVRSNIEELPRMAQETLKVASCMGDEVDDSALDLILQTQTGRYLEQAAAEGLLVFVPQSGGYRFAHDWIRHTAFALIPKEEREEFHLRIGRKLWKMSTAAAVEKNVFVVVSLLNKGIKLIKEQRERYRVAELNLKAGEKAMAVSAFPDASKFLRKGIQLLGGNRWNDYYSLTLSLYSAAAEVETINGNYERVVMYIEEIVQMGQHLEDKLRAYSALIRAMGEQDNMEEATAVGIDVLGQLNEPLPKKPSKWAVVRELGKAKMALRGKTNQELMSLPVMHDPIKSACLQILNLIFQQSYQARSPYTAIVAFRSIVITLKFGLHPASSVAFAVYATMLCGLGLDVHAGRRYGELSISLAEKLQARESTSMVYFLVGAGVNHWSGPIKSTFDQLLYASRSAMEVGDVEVAVIAKATKCVYALFTGSSLNEVEEELDECIKTARLYRKNLAQTFAQMLLQLIHCYDGRAKNSARLTGTAINFNEAMKECVDINNKTWVAALFFYALDVSYAFGDYDFASMMAEGNRDLQKTPSALFPTVENRYKEALNAIAQIRLGVSKGANKKTYRHNLKQISIWAKQSPQSYMQKKLLLEAEVHSIRGPKGKLKGYPLYEEAIKASASQGYDNETALVLERFADFKVVCGEPMEAVTLYERSMSLYEKWGALAKCDHIRKRVDRLKM